MAGPPLIVPGEYLDVSGVVRISGAPLGLDEAERRALQTLGASAAFVAVAEPPSFHDQLGVYATPEELFRFVLGSDGEMFADHLLLSGDDVVGLVKGLPFEPAMRFVAYYQRALALAGRRRGAQLSLARSLYGNSPITAACAMFLRANDHGVVVSEQQLFALQRLLALYARDEAADDLSPEENVAIRVALLHIPGTILAADADLDQDSPEVIEDERWVRYFIGNGGLVGHGSLKHDLARAHRMYEVIANSSAASRHRDYCPLDEWLRDRLQLGFVELQALGFALYAGSKIGDDDVPPVALDARYFATTKLATRADLGLDAIAAPRAWFIRAFEGSKQHPRRAAFEIHPFLRRPALRQSDGKVIVLAPRGIQAWLSATGAYYRFLDLARERGIADMKRFSRFNGWLQERYAQHLTYVAHPDQRRRTLAGSGRVMPESEYDVPKRGRSKTSDVAIDLGQDLVLIEVTAKRITAKSLVEGDPKAVRDDLRMLVVENMKQLGRVITDIFSGVASLPDVQPEYVERVWPIVVSADGLFQTPSTWAHIQREGAGYLRLDPTSVPAQVKPLVLLDLEEFEVLMGLVGAGESLVRILEAKTSSAWVERDFKAWLMDGARREDFDVDFVSAELGRAFRKVVGALALGRPTS